MKLSDVLQRDLTLELWDYGTAIEEFDWSRLPTFKSPHEHGFYAGEHKPRRHTIKNSAVLRTLMRPRGSPNRAPTWRDRRRPGRA